VRYINPFPAGGATDTLSRLFCAKMSELTGQQWIVENKGGSGGNVGMDALAQSPADGYTLGLGGIASHAIAPTLYAKLPFNPRSDFTFVSTIWQLPNMLVVNLDVPAIAETLPGFDINSWTTLTGPAKLPADVVQRLSELSRKALESEDLKAKFIDLAATAVWRSPADTLAYRDSEQERLAPIIKASGARVD
jgi:tripartite-type tricarboxylate transporter receptor subunit TctC